MATTTKKNPSERRRFERPAPVPLNSRRPAWASYWPLGCPLPGSVGYDALPWPERVPVLTGADLCLDHVIPLEMPPYNLDGWLEATFGETGFVASLASIALDGVVSRRLGRTAAAWEYLHEKDVKRADAVSAWKEALDLLGYAMDQPERPKKFCDQGSDYGAYFH